MTYSDKLNKRLDLIGEPIQSLKGLGKQQKKALQFYFKINFPGWRSFDNYFPGWHSFDNSVKRVIISLVKRNLIEMTDYNQARLTANGYINVELDQIFKGGQVFC